MKTILDLFSADTLIMVSLLLVVIYGFASWIASRPRGAQMRPLANVAEGRWANSAKAYYADEVIGSRNLLMTAGSDDRHVAICDESDKPVGFCPDEAEAIEDLVTVLGFGAPDYSQLGVSDGVIAAGGDCYAADGGKVQAEPTTAGTYYLVGRNIGPGTADGDDVQIDPCEPIRVVVIAAFTGPQTADGSDAGTTQTLANALKADLAALDGALATPSLIKVLAP